MTPLFTTKYTVLERHSPTILRYTRTAVPYTTLESIGEDFEGLLAALRGLETSSMGLVIDVRKVKGRNDAAFEKAHAGYRRRLVREFRAIAVVVRTVVGKMQIQRYAQEDGMTFPLFGSVEEAEAWLREAL